MARFMYNISILEISIIKNENSNFIPGVYLMEYQHSES
jgi:hypothetical protein